MCKLSFVFLQLPDIERKVKEAGQTILTPLVSLDTPGKATVEVVILADPVSLSSCLFSPFLLLTLLCHFFFSLLPSLPTFVTLC